MFHFFLALFFWRRRKEWYIRCRCLGWVSYMNFKSCARIEEFYSIARIELIQFGCNVISRIYDEFEEIMTPAVSESTLHPRHYFRQSYKLRTEIINTESAG